MRETKEMQKRLIALIMALMLIFTLGCASACSDMVEEEEVLTEVLENSEIRAQDDFYGYVNKDILLNAPIDYKYGSYSDTQMSVKRTEEFLDEMIEEIAESDTKYEEGTCEWAVQKMYNQALEYLSDDSVKASHTEELDEVVDCIINAKSVKELENYVVANTKTYGLSQLFSIQPDMNYLNTDEYSLYISTPDNCMGVDYEEIFDNKNMAFGIQNNSVITLRALGYDDEYVQEKSRKVAYLAIDIANNMDYEIYNTNDRMQFMEFISKDELKEIFAEVDYETLEAALGLWGMEYDGLYTYNARAVRYLQNVLTDEHLEELKVIELFFVFSNYADELNGGKRDVSVFTVTNTKPVKKQAVKMVKDNLTSELSYLYTNRVYTDAEEKYVCELVEDIKNEYKEVIGEAEWLTVDTRNKLKRKIDGMILITPDYERKRENRSNVTFGKDYFETGKLCMESEWNEVFEDPFGQRDKKVPSMSMQTVNACYSPDNVITLTAAILQGTIYDEKAGYFQNLGGIGSTLAHEIGHAFDDTGMKWDENGNYNPTNINGKDREALEERNLKAIEYFETAFTVFDVYHVDGAKSLGENFADLSAVEICLRMCVSDDDKREFLESYALTWGTVSDVSETIEGMMNDPHSPETIRVNAVIATCEDFYSLYDVKEGDGMYIEPERRISRWF